MAQENKLSIDECYNKLKYKYDGYHFCEDSPGMYNPFSLLNTFISNKFRDYWFETGTPTLLVNVMKQTLFDVTRFLEDIDVSAFSISSLQDIAQRPIPLMHQTGYLTIKGYDKEFKEYTLGFPNDEVKNCFLKSIYPYFVSH